MIWPMESPRCESVKNRNRQQRHYGISLEQYRKLAAERGKEQSLLRALIDSIPDLIFFKDPSGIYLGCNKAFEGFAGHTEADIIGLTDLDIFPREVGGSFQEMDRQMMSLRLARRNEEWVDYPDGGPVLFETLKTPFHHEAGNNLGLIGISRDITERKWAEEERKNSKPNFCKHRRWKPLDSLPVELPTTSITSLRLLLVIPKSFYYEWRKLVPFDIILNKFTYPLNGQPTLRGICLPLAGTGTCIQSR